MPRHIIPRQPRPFKFTPYTHLFCVWINCVFINYGARSIQKNLCKGVTLRIRLLKVIRKFFQDQYFYCGLYFGESEEVLC